MFFTGSGNHCYLGNNVAGCVHGIPDLSRSSNQQACEGILPGTHKWRWGECCQRSLRDASNRKCDEQGHSPARQVEEAGSGATSQYLWSAYYVELEIELIGINVHIMCY